MSQAARRDQNGKSATGWQGHLLQDESRELSRWLASKPEAMRLARLAVAEIKKGKV